MRTVGVESDINRMQKAYKGMGLMTEDKTAGGSVEGDIASLQRRNQGLRKATAPVRDEMRRSGGKSYRSSAIEFARNLLKKKGI